MGIFLMGTLAFALCWTVGCGDSTSSSRPAATTTTAGSNPAAQTRVEVDIPSVACSVDGQTGPRTPSVLATAKALLTPSIAAQLSVYSDGSFYVLAPRGWRCVESYGSSGVHLRVIPGGSAFTDAQIRAGNITAQAVTVDYWTGDTSGRFEVAGVGAPLFQNLVQLATQLQSGFPTVRIRTSPWVGESLEIVTTALARYQDPPNTSGTGTNETGLSVSAVAISGFVRQVPSGHSPEAPPNLIVLAVRLEATNAVLVSPIAADFEERSKGP